MSNTLKYPLTNLEHLLYLLNHLPHLSMVELVVLNIDPDAFIAWFNEQSSNFSMTCHLEEIFLSGKASSF